MARMQPDDRRAQLLDAAVAEAEQHGYQNITRDRIAKRAGVSVGLVSKYFKTMPQLKRDVMRAAVRRSVLRIIAQGLACADPHAQKAPEDVREAAKATL